ncbi:MAG: hypothetical protein MRZ74_10775 [Blautia sp.]|nr:hypothetical protein [Blautia sp.]
MNDFEWSNGYAERFDLAYVEYCRRTASVDGYG